MPKQVKCPNNGCIIDHFNHIGDISNRVCPTCGEPISDEEVANIEVVADDSKPQE